MTEDWELNFRVQTCDCCNELYCEETGITKDLHTGYNTKRVLHFCGETCLHRFYIQELHR